MSLIFKEPILVLFESVHDTLKMEDLLDKNQIVFRSVVKPRALATDCGIAIKIEKAQKASVHKLAEMSQLQLVDFFQEINGCWLPCQESTQC